MFVWIKISLLMLEITLEKVKEVKEPLQKGTMADCTERLFTNRILTMSFFISAIVLYFYTLRIIFINRCNIYSWPYDSWLVYNSWLRSIEIFSSTYLLNCRHELQSNIPWEEILKALFPLNNPAHNVQESA